MDQAASEYYTHLRRASIRGLGDPKHSEPLVEDVLLRLEAASRFNHCQRLRFLGYVVAWHILLRGDELTVLSCSLERVEIHDGSATLHITGDKTNIRVTDKKRVVGCCCDTSHLLCPTHCLEALVEAGKRRAGSQPLNSIPLLCRENGNPYSNQSLLYWFRLDLSGIGVKVVGKRSEHLFGLHAFQRGGAQALARAGWSSQTISAWARWESNIIQQYVAEAPLGVSTTFASTIVGGCGVHPSRMASGPAGLVEGPCAVVASRASARKPFGVRRVAATRTTPAAPSSAVAPPLVELVDALVSGSDALLDVP